MASILGILNIGQQALQAQQTALSVTAQNISNVNTPGYSRQVAAFETAVSGVDGGGVKADEIQRVVNQFIEGQVVSEQSSLGQYTVEQRVLDQIQSTFNDLQGGGIHQVLSEFFSSLQDLANNPTGFTERTALLAKATALAQQFNGASAQLQQIRTDLNTEIQADLRTVNTLAQQIADVNHQISQAVILGQSPNTLLDQRGQLVNQLADLVSVNTFEDSQGQTTIMVAGQPLVEGSVAHALQGTPDPDNGGLAKIQFDSGGGTLTDLGSFTGGQLKALLDLRDTVVPGYLDQLDRLAASVVNGVNQAHQTGYGLDGSTGLAFFQPLAPTATALSANAGSATVAASVGDPAQLTFDRYQLSISGGNYTILNVTTGNSITGAYGGATAVAFEGLDFTIGAGAASGDVFSVSAHEGEAGRMAAAITDPNQVAASATAAGVPGDNSNALRLAGLQNQTMTSLGGATLQGYYGSMVGMIGASAQQAQSNLSAQQTIHQQLDAMRQSISGVSLDQEMTNLLMYQRAYQAAAKLIAVADQIYQTLLEMKQ